MRVDLHVHSRFSERPAHWLLKRLGCNESHTEPREIYRLARDKGMSLVTLTDHNTIDGCLELAGLPDTFISEEVTTYFPDDGCKLHVLVYDITEEQHREIQCIREDVFDLVGYLRAHGIVHALAHPFYPVNDRLTLEHIEKLLLLFQLLEVNGDQPQESNELVQVLSRALTPRMVDRLANKHGIAPTHLEPWKKGIVGGSDDHSSLYVARAFTEVPGATAPRGFLAEVAAGRATASFDRAGCSPQAVAHGIYSIAYQFLRQKAGGSGQGRRDLLTYVLDWLLAGSVEEERSTGSKLRRLWNTWLGLRRRPAARAFGLDTLREEVLGLLSEERGFSEKVKSLHGSAGPQAAWFHVVNRVSNRALRRFGDQMLDHFLHGNVFDVFQSLGAAGALYGALAPYFFAFSAQAAQRGLQQQVRQRLLADAPASSDTPLIVHFVGTGDRAAEVAQELRSLGADPAPLHTDPLVLTCQDQAATADGVRTFKPIGTHDLPEYPGGKLCYPPFLEVVSYCHGCDPTHIHTLTPGPLGLAALGVARILRLPLVASVDADWLQQAVHLAEQSGAEELLWTYLAWFYNQAAAVLVPSEDVCSLLAARGVAPAKLRVAGSGFNPARLLGEVANLQERPGDPPATLGPVPPAGLTSAMPSHKTRLDFMETTHSR